MATAQDRISPVIAGTRGNQKSYDGMTLQPFAGVSISDSTPGAVDFVTIQADTSVGTLTDGPGYTGLAPLSLGGTLVSYTFEASPAEATARLDALIYTPTGSFRRNNLFLDVTDAATEASTSDLTTTIDNGTNTDAISVDPAVTYSPNGGFTLTGSASSARVVGGLSLSGTVDGATMHLGSGAPNGRGGFVIYDAIGAETQTDLVATETDLDGLTKSAPVPFDLQGGVEGEPYVAVQTLLDPTTRAPTSQTFFGADGTIVFLGDIARNADGTQAETFSGGTYFDDLPFFSFTDTVRSDGTPLSEVRDRDDGSHVVLVQAPGQTLTSDSFDLFLNHGAPSNTFIFDPGHGADTVRQFRADGGDHDTLSFAASDFGGTLATVLRNIHATSQGSAIVDPTTGDVVRLPGIRPGELRNNPGDIAVHGG